MFTKTEKEIKFPALPRERDQVSHGLERNGFFKVAGEPPRGAGRSWRRKGWSQEPRWHGG